MPKDKDQVTRPLTKFTYREDFSEGELNGWASYPHCQDNAYDPFTWPGKIKSSDEGKCFITYKDPPWEEDQLLGGFKLLDMVLDKDFKLSFRYYIKSIGPCSELKVDFPMITEERPSYVLKNPKTNKWEKLTIDWKDLVSQNKFLKDRKDAQITGVTITAEYPKADPHLSIYFGFDEVVLEGKKVAPFNFETPEVAVLSEWPERIPLKHYRPGDTLEIKGNYDFTPDEVDLVITSFTDRETPIHTEKLTFSAGKWTSGSIAIDSRFPVGLYYGKISAVIKGNTVSETAFTVFVPPEIGGKHPRLFFNDSNIETVRERMMSEQFTSVRENFTREAEKYREKCDPCKLTFDLDQFPTDDWIETLYPWYIDRFMTPREAMFHNAVVYKLLGDIKAGEYARDVLMAYTKWDFWNHPWMLNRGFYTYYPVAEFSDSYALAYDLMYDLLTEEERYAIRTALVEKFVKPAWRSYVEDNLITTNSSNWISHLAGGGIVAQSAVYGDSPELAPLEPWLTGFILKEWKYINTIFGPSGSYGEGYRYYSFAMQSFSKTLPVLKDVFNIDFAGPMENSYLETLWAGIPRANLAFTFGDSEPNLKKEAQASWIGSQNGPMNSWAWLLAKTKDPLLSWLYNYIKDFDTLNEILHPVEGIPTQDPDTLGNVKFFPEVGTAVFKSGWNLDDFVFAFRSGPFFNHQHLDQGTFYFADHGKIFIEDRHDGEHHYYDDPIYQSHAIQAISHNTILVNDNPQSQRTGDCGNLGAGFNQNAKFTHWLDSGAFSFAAGELEKVYMGKVSKLTRNVLYIKPRTVLMVDEVLAEKDVEINRMYHTLKMPDINLTDLGAAIKKEGAGLHLISLGEPPDKEIVNDPHFKCQFDNCMPLTRRGHLRLNGRTKGGKLVMAELMNATPDGRVPDVTVNGGSAKFNLDGVSGNVAVNRDGKGVAAGAWSSDALILAEAGGEVFVASGTKISNNGSDVVRSSAALTGAVSLGSGMKMTLHNQEPMTLTVAVDEAPTVKVNSIPVNADYDAGKKTAVFDIPSGEVVIEIS